MSTLIAEHNNGDLADVEFDFASDIHVTVPDTKVWLTNPVPAGFLRWESPILLPNDQLIRVDLLPGTNSGSAEPVESKR